MQKGDPDVFVSGGIQYNHVYVPGKQEYRVLHPLKMSSPVVTYRKENVLPFYVQVPVLVAGSDGCIEMHRCSDDPTVRDSVLCIVFVLSVNIR